MVSGVRDEGERVVVRVGKLRRGARCARCGTQSRGVHQRMRWRRVWHLAVAGQEGSLECRPRWYWCGPCQRPFTEAYEEIRTWGRRSRLSKALLLRELAGQSVGAVTRKTGLGYRAPRGVVERAEGSPPWATLLRQAGPDGLALGSDEHSVRGPQLVTTVTEVWQHRVLGTWAMTGSRPCGPIWRACRPRSRARGGRSPSI